MTNVGESFAIMAAKRKKVFLSMEDKLEALKRLDKGETSQKIADHYGVGCRTFGK